MSQTTRNVGLKGESAVDTATERQAIVADFEDIEQKRANVRIAMKGKLARIEKRFVGYAGVQREAAT